MTFRCYSIFSLLIFPSVSITGVASAQNNDAAAPGGGWNAAGTWSQGVIPNSALHTNTRLTGGATVTLNATPATNPGLTSVGINVTAAGDTGTLNHSGGILDTDGANSDFRVGLNTDTVGIYNSSAGASGDFARNVNIGIGNNSSAVNTANVNGTNGAGTGGFWNVGASSTGLFIIGQDLNVGSNANSYGVVNMEAGNGANLSVTRNLRVGLNGDLANNAGGYLNVDDGTITVGNRLDVGQNANSYGQVRQSSGVVQNTTSANNFLIGVNGTGIYEVTGDAQLIQNRADRDIYVGFNNGATGELRIGVDALGATVATAPAAPATSNVSSARDVYVGWDNNASGTVIQADGSLYANRDLRIAQDNAGSSGSYVQTGGTVETNRHTIVGVLGTGTYDISGGELMVGLDAPTAQHSATPNAQADGVNNEQLLIGQNTGATGTFNQSGGLVQVDQLMVVGNNGGTGTLNLSSGTLTVGDSASDGAEHLFIANVGANANRSTGSVTVSGGTLNVGDQTGTNSNLQIQQGDASFTQTGGTVAIENNFNLSAIGTTQTGSGIISLTGGMMTIGNNLNDRNGTTLFGVGGTAMLDVTNNLGFDQGTNPDTFTVTGSTQMITVGNNLVVTNGNIINFVLDGSVDSFKPLTVGSDANFAGGIGQFDVSAWGNGYVPFGTQIDLVDIGSAGTNGTAGIFENFGEFDLVGQSGITGFRLSRTGNIGDTVFTGGGNALVLIAVPEPSRAVLLVLGISSLMLRRRR